ncbi:MAG: DinB family protein [Ilumatobacteraceae bacterium]
MADARRPTSDVDVVVLDSLDYMMSQLVDRLAGIGDQEYLWEPVGGMWSARQREDGSVTVDGAGERHLEPAPVTTIAWRLWHLAVDCFDDYTRRLAGDGRDLAPDPSWYLDPGSALDALATSWSNYRDTLAGRPDWWAELGEAWGPWGQHSTVDIALHSGNELVHHGAEIALLRDLYLNRSAAST